MSNCRCGRILGIKPHCPHCGSTFIYGTKTANRNAVKDGEIYVIRAFQCRHCNQPFDESMECCAPPTKEVQRMQSIYGNKPKTKSDMDLIEAARELRKEHVLNAVALGERKLTQELEDTIQAEYGISLSKSMGMPIVENGEDEPQISHALTDEEWNALQQKEEQK